MTTKKEPPKESVPVITGSGLEAAANKNSKKRVRLVVLLIVLVIALAAGFTWMQDRSKPSNNKKDGGPTAGNFQDIPTDRDIAQAAVTAGDYDGGLKILQDQFNQAKTPTDKAAALNEMALAALNGDKFDDAINYATQANSLKETARAWGLIGSAAFQQQNWQLAYDAFDKAAKLTPDVPADGIRSQHNQYLEQQNQAKANL